MPTTAIPDEETRQRLAEEGAELISSLVQRMDVPHVVEQLRKLEAYGHEVEAQKPWVPSAYNRNKR